jgi:hypothetical protein
MKNKFEIWKTIKLGTYKSVEEILLEFATRQEIGLGYRANYVLRQPELLISKTETVINLVKIQVRELGPLKNLYYKSVFFKGEEIGFKICPGEVGLQLRLQYTDQPRDENLTIAMKPILDLEKNTFLFTNSCYLDVGTLKNRLWLHTKSDTDASCLFFGEEDYVVFCLFYFLPIKNI